MLSGEALNRMQGELGMWDHLINAGFVLVCALFLVWILFTLATGVTLNALL